MGAVQRTYVRGPRTEPRLDRTQPASAQNRDVPAPPTAFSPATVSRVALLNAIANGVIVVPGGAVRLPGSGLACPTWPRATDSSFVATRELAGRCFMEFDNRLLTFGISAV